MTYLADHPGIIHAVVVCCTVLGLGMLALGLVAKFADWYVDRHERHRRAYRKATGRYADGLEDQMDWEENVERRTP